MIQVAVAGNIGSGKTTLTRMLSDSLSFKPLYETLEQNPYINDFYQDMPRWSFNLQVYFLHSRLMQTVEIRKGNENVIQDRTIYEDAYIFAPNLFEMGLLTERDFKTYTDLFKLSTSLVQAPDLLIYLKSSVNTLVRQINNRGREYEINISRDYLKNLNENYNRWISDYDLGKVLVIDIDKLNFLESDAAYQKVLDLVRAQISLVKG